MSRAYEINNIAAIKGHRKSRDELPPALNLVLTARFQRFKDFIDTVADREEHKTFKRHTAVDVTFDNQRYVMCTSVRTIRGLRSYKLIELLDAEEVADYHVIKDHYRFNHGHK